MINPAEDNRKKQCKRNEAKPNSNAIHPRKDTIILRIATPQIASSNSTLKRRTYTGMRLHTPGQQAGGYLVPARTERHSAERVDATASTKPPMSCQLSGASASLPIKWKAKCPG